MTKLEKALENICEKCWNQEADEMTHTPEKWYVWDDKVTGEDKVEIIAENIRDEKTAHQIKAIPDMLEALEEVMDELDVEGLLPCPLCGGSAASGHKYNCLWHVVNAAITKARGEV